MCVAIGAKLFPLLELQEAYNTIESFVDPESLRKKTVELFLVTAFQY
jgi:hypothetical protein